MATVVLHPDPQSFPIGTTVKVRERVEPHAPYTAEPPGAILSEPVVASAGTLTVTVTEGHLYVGYAEVGGVKHYLLFESEVATGGGGGGAVTSVNTKTGAVTLAAADVGADVEGEATTKAGERLLKTGNLSELTSQPTARTNLGLGTAATQPSSAFDATGAATAAQGASTPKQKKHTLVTTTGTTAVANQVTPIETGASNLTILLPEAATEGDIVSIIKSDAGAGEVTIEGKLDGAGAVGSAAILRLINDGRSFLCLADKTWTRLAAYLSVSALDSRYALTTDSRLTNERTPSASSVTAAKIAANAVETAAIKDANVTKAKLAEAVQEELEPKVVEKSWVVPGEPKAETYPGFEVKLGTHETKNLIGMSVKLIAGTSCVVKILKNGTLITSYEATAKSTESTRVASSKALSNEDEITLKVETLTGKPEGLRVTLFVESVK